jgi:starch synthase
MTQPTLKVLFLAAEADPFVKIGGLGDVAGSLPLALRALSSATKSRPQVDVDVRLAIPLHGSIRGQNYPLHSVCTYSIPYRGGPVQATALSLDVDGLPVYLIGGTLIPPEVPVYTTDAYADGLKFTFFSLAALELARQIGWQPDLVHANDWHTAPALYALNLRRESDPFYSQTAALLGLHNLPYLGIGVGQALVEFGLPPAVDSALPWWAQDMPLPLGLLSADHIVAVSPGYAQEILTAEFGAGLQDFLRTRAEDISGILNGLDLQHWDPQNDEHLPATFNARQLKGRAANKAALQKEFGLPVEPHRPLIGMIGRLAYQKGVDWLPEALRLLATAPAESGQPWQMILLGSGEEEMEAVARQLEGEFPGRVRAAIRFDAALSRRIYGGADMLLIPSRYEPCGEVQMIAMHYGCVPVAHATGGLRDTIQDYSHSADSTGFLFDEASPEDLASALSRALQTYRDQKAWQALQRRGMQRDFSWSRSAEQYRDLYLSLVTRRNPQFAAANVKRGGKA